MDVARLYALDTITAIFNKKKYSNIEINHTLANKEMDQRSKGLYTQLVYGVLKNKILLDHYLKPYLKGKNLKEWVRHLLEMSIYQLVFLDRIPDYAITSDAVEICKRKDSLGTARLVNGVLRSFDTKHLNPLRPQDEYIKYSCNEWLLKQIKGQYKDDYEKIFEAFNNRNKNTARVNILKTTRDKIVSKNPNCMKSDFCKSAVIFKRGSIANSREYKNGLVSIQDEASQMVALYLNPLPSDRVLDVCAAPGGKTCHLAEIMHGNGLVIANDVHAHKMKLIEDNVNRLGLKNVKITNYDGKKLNKIYMPNDFDKILLDAPCSGWGAIKRKPEIKYFSSEEDIEEILQLQADLLAAITRILVVNGELVYSTCTLNKAENEVQIRKFLEKNPNFKLVSQKTILPYEHDTDGFYMAKLKKVAR